MAKPTPQNALAAMSIELVGELEFPEPVGQDLRRIEAALLVWPETQLSHDGSDSSQAC